MVNSGQCHHLTNVSACQNCLQNADIHRIRIKNRRTFIVAKVMWRKQMASNFGNNKGLTIFGTEITKTARISDHLQVSDFHTYFSEKNTSLKIQVVL